jgi:hypothetical protein
VDALRIAQWSGAAMRGVLTSRIVVLDPIPARAARVREPLLSFFIFAEL